MQYQQKYLEAHKLIKKKIREAKEAYLSEKCNKIEEYEKKYDYHNMHKKIKELTLLRKKNIVAK